MTPAPNTASTLQPTARARSVVVLRRFIMAVVILLPLLLVTVAPRLQSDGALSAYLPATSDEIYYWRQALSFQNVGFDSGYFTQNEQPARIGNYYSWGVFVPMFQGTVGKIFGWSLASIPILNALLMSLALALFMALTKLDLERLSWLLLALVTFMPFVLFQMDSTIEVTLQALAVVIAAAFYVLMTASARRTAAVVGLIAITVGSLFRPTMGLFFIPFCLLLPRRSRARSIGLTLIAGVGLWLATWLAVWMTYAPDPRPRTIILALFPSNPSQALVLMLANARENIVQLLAGTPPEIFQRLEILLIVVILVLTVFWKRSAIIRRLGLRVSPAETYLHLYNLGLILFLYILLYDVFAWRDFRGAAPNVLLSVLLFVAFRRRAWLALIVVSGLLFLPITLGYYNAGAAEHLSTEVQAAYPDWQSKLASVVVYQPNAPTVWCNTVLHTLYYFEPEPSVVLLALDSGIGLSFFQNPDELAYPPKSRYLLFDNTFYQQHADQLHVEPLIDVPGGKLYLNLDSACPSSAASR